jgi:hypothetical protein
MKRIPLTYVLGFVPEKGGEAAMDTREAIKAMVLS